MNGNIDSGICTTNKKSFFGTVISAIRDRFCGMGHIGVAFILPVMVMVLIYTAMGVFPFGNNSVLVLDLNGQYVYFFEAIRDFFRGEQGIIYSFERALGGEFLGIVAYYLASPFSFIVALFPEGMITESIYVILLLKCGLSGMNMCVYLHKSHPTKPIGEVIFSLMYALCSYAVVMQHNTMWMDCFLFLPLIFLGLESLIKYKKYKLFVLTLAAALFSNYYIGYMVCFGVAAYFFFSYFRMDRDERNPLGEKAHFIKSVGRVAAFSILAIGMASIIILPAVYSLGFGKSTFTDPNFDFVQKFDFLDLIAKMFPASYDTVRPEGLPFVFSGTLVLILLPVFFLAEQISPRLKIAGGAIMAFYIFSFNSSTIDIFWHGMQRPNWLNYRYSFMLCFAIIFLSYLAFEHIESINFRIVLSVGAVLGLIICVIQKLDYKNVPDLMCVWFSLACIAFYMILLAGCNKGWLGGKMASVLLIFTVLELFSNGLAEVVSLDADVHFSSRTSYTEFMEKWKPAADWINENDKSFFRAEKTEHRKTNDNFALNIKGLSNSTSTLNSSQIEFLERMGYSSRSHWSKYLGGTPVSDSLLGLKYIITTSENKMNRIYGDPVWTDEEHGTAVYENIYAQSLGFAASPSLADLDLSEKTSPFERMNEMITDILGSRRDIEVFKPYTMVGTGYDNCELSYIAGHKKYLKLNDNRDAVVHFDFTALTDDEIFMYIPSEYIRNTRVEVNGVEISEYYTNETCRILSLGMFDAGEDVSVTVILDDDVLYIESGVDYFYYIDNEVFAEAMAEMAENSFEIEKFSDSSFEGRITTTEDRNLLLLSIPYDKGWNIYVDGEKVESFMVLDCLTAVEISEGEHTIRMEYMPDIVVAGIVLSIFCNVVFAAIVVIEIAVKRRRKKKAAVTAEATSEG